MNSKKPLILVTNDDGINAPGIRFLIDIMNDFGDVVDFIGWYGNTAHRRAGIARNDAGALYLAYHEGIGGYSRGSHTEKAWLLPVAWKVDARAGRYQTQYDGCRKSLERKRFLGIF